MKVQFTVDRAGRVLIAQIVQSSGSPLLDAEAIAMLFRAATLPFPPAETSETSFDLLLPVRFAIGPTLLRVPAPANREVNDIGRAIIMEVGNAIPVIPLAD